MVQAPNADWETGMVSWIALDGKGTLYLIQRGEKADPVLVVDLEGHLLRSWGKGLYKIPHSIRIDPHGNIKALLRRGRGYRDMNYLLLKAQRLAATKTEFLVLHKAA